MVYVRRGGGVVSHLTVLKMAEERRDIDKNAVWISRQEAAEWRNVSNNIMEI